MTRRVARGIGGASRFGWPRASRKVPAVRWSLFGVVVLTVSCGRTHTLDDGAYAFALAEVLRDDCALSQDPHVMTTGTLITTGNLVALDYGFLDVKLKGIYLSKEERMTLDGTAANIDTTVRGNECLLDTVAIHMETDTSANPTHFSGAMSIAFDARQNTQCVCQMWVKFNATKK